MVDYLTECTVWRDSDPRLAEIDRMQQAATVTLQRLPNGSGPWLVSQGIWTVAEIFRVPDAKFVVCEFCGRKLDIGGGEVPCQTCGAMLSFPAGVGQLPCPYCASSTFRM